MGRQVWVCNNTPHHPVGKPICWWEEQNLPRSVWSYIFWVSLFVLPALILGFL